MTAPPASHVTGADLVAAGLTYRKVDYWTRRGWLRADNADCGSGHSRTFPLGELVVAVTMELLTKAGVTVEGAHRAARNGGELTPRVRVTITGGQMS